LGDTRAFKGCIKVDVFADDTSKTYTLIEEWESFAAYDSYMKWRTEQADVRARDLLDGVKTYEWGTKTDIYGQRNEMVMLLLRYDHCLLRFNRNWA
jgi:hypothetical protein